MCVLGQLKNSSETTNSRFIPTGLGDKVKDTFQVTGNIRVTFEGSQNARTPVETETEIRNGGDLSIKSQRRKL